VEYRYHGSLLTRIVPRLEEQLNGDRPEGGRLCVMGRFEHTFLNHSQGSSPRDGRGKPIGWAQAAERLEAAVNKSRKPLMRLSPYLPGEVLDRALQFARRRGIAVEAAGLQDLDPGWARLLAAPKASATSEGSDGAADGSGQLFESRNKETRGSVLLLVQGLEEANNVAFTECLAMGREPNISLWYVGELKPVYRRFFQRHFPQVNALAEALAAAQAAGAGRVEILLNPEMVLKTFGKKAEKTLVRALENILGGDEEGGSATRLTLFWNSRNAAYLLHALEGKASAAGAAKASPDLILQVGPAPGFHRVGTEKAAAAAVKEPAATGAEVVRWGWRGQGADLFIPLERSLWLSGYSEPSGRTPRRAGSPSPQALKSLIMS
jgi:hypothetical protein